MSTSAFIFPKITAAKESNNNVAKVEFLYNAQEGPSGLLVYAELHSPPFRDRGNTQYLPLARIYPPYRDRGTEKNEWSRSFRVL